MEKDFEFLLRLMQPDTLFVPKSLIKCTDISDEAILIFSEIFTENRFGTIDDIKAEINNVPDKLIEAYAENSKKRGKNRTSSKIKTDLRKISDNLELLLTNERSVNA